MAMELILIMALNNEPDIDYLNNKATEHRVDLEYKVKLSLERQTGFYPIQYKGGESGFEIYKLEYSKVIEMLPPPENGFPKGGNVYQFRFGASHNEPAVTFYTASFFAELSGIYVFETQGGQYMSAAQLFEGAKFMEKTDEK